MVISLQHQTFRQIFQNAQSRLLVHLPLFRRQLFAQIVRQLNVVFQANVDCFFILQVKQSSITTEQNNNFVVYLFPDCQQVNSFVELFVCDEVLGTFIY